MDHPKTFNEYLCSEKIKDYKLEYWKYADKFEVKKYVSSVVGEKYLNDVIGIYDSFDEIDFFKLPERFVMKATHESGFNVIVKDKNKLDIEKSFIVGLNIIIIIKTEKKTIKILSQEL